VDMQYSCLLWSVMLVDPHASGSALEKWLLKRHGLYVLSLTFSIDCDMYRLLLY
jgi:hypothetical protein